MLGSTSTSQRNKTICHLLLAMPCWKNSVIWRCWYTFPITQLNTTTCVTFTDRFTIWKEKGSVLIKLGFYKLVHTKPSVSSRKQMHPADVGRVTPSRSRQMWFVPALHSAWSTMLTLGSPQSRYLARLLFDFFFIHHHHLRLPLRRTGMYKAGSVGSGQAIFLPSAWPGGGFAAESFSAWQPVLHPQSRSNPATPWAVFLAVPHYLAVRGSRETGK